MSLFNISGFVVLLLPAVLAFLIPASPDASPDPWKVKRIRRSLVLFSLFVAAIHLAYYRFQIFIWRESVSPPQPSAEGTFIWSVMAWFFLVVLFWELRRPKQDPFPGQSRRSASLKPRHLKSPVPRAAWWSLGLVWVVAAAAVVLTMPTVPAVSWVLLVAAATLVPLAPWLERNQLLSGEPLPETSSAEIREAYARRRRMRSWSLWLLVAFGVVLKSGVALIAGRDDYLYLAPSVLMTGFAALMAFMATYAVLEAFAKRRISDAGAPSVAEGS